MAYILRSIVVIGVIALNSPIHGGKAPEGGAVRTAHDLAASVARIDAHGAMQGLSAAREAAQILAGLDPETRQRLLAATLPGASGRSEAQERRPGDKPR